MSTSSQPLIVCTSSTALRIWVCWLTTVLALTALTNSVTAWSQEPAAGPDAPMLIEVESEAGDPTAIPEDEGESVDAALVRIRALGADTRRLEQRLDSADGLALKVLETRLARYWNEFLTSGPGHWPYRPPQRLLDVLPLLLDPLYLHPHIRPFMAPNSQYPQYRPYTQHLLPKSARLPVPNIFVPEEPLPLPSRRSPGIIVPMMIPLAGVLRNAQSLPHTISSVIENNIPIRLR